MLEVAEAGEYCAVWSEAILDELEDTLLYLFDQKPAGVPVGGVPTPATDSHRVPDAIVTG